MSYESPVLTNRIDPSRVILEADAESHPVSEGWATSSLVEDSTRQSTYVSRGQV